MQWFRHLSLQAAPYANVVKEWFKLPGGWRAARQVFPPSARKTTKTQQNRVFPAGMAAAQSTPTDQKGAVADG
jgi:hypothetical protein